MNLEYLSENIVYNDYLKIDKQLLDAYQLYRDLNLKQPLFTELIRKQYPEKNNFVFIDGYSGEKNNSFPGDIGNIHFLRDQRFVQTSIILIGAYYFEKNLCYLYFDHITNFFLLVKDIDNEKFIETFFINSNHNIKEFLYEKFIEKLKSHFSYMTDCDKEYEEKYPNYKIIDYSYFCYEEKSLQNEK